MGPISLFVAAALLLTVVGTAALIRTFQRPSRKTFAYALAKELPTSPDELGLAFVERQFDLADGSSTPGWIIEGSRPGGPVVVVSHGWNSSRYRSLTKAPLLAPHASKLVLYDLRAHGDSTATACCMGTAEVDDLLRVVEQSAPPDAPVVLLGSSLGAGVSIAAAASDGAASRRIVAVVAEGPYRTFVEPIVGQLWVRRFPPFPVAWLATAYMAIRAGGLQDFDRARLAGRLRCPLLVLHGTDDPVCPLDSARRIAQAAPDGKLVTFDGLGHTNLAVADPPRYIQAVSEFLQTIQVAAPGPAPTSTSQANR